MHRRRFLSYVAFAPLCAASGCRRRRPSPRRADAGAGPASAVVLDQLQWATLAAACARIMPTDADPGATEAGVVGYIDGQLAHPPVSGFRPLILAGLRRLEFIARRVARAPFVQLPPEKQDQVLTLIGRSKRIAGGHTGQRFLQILVVLTLEGFLCDPLYGGNRDGVGWKLVGFQPRSPGPRAPYRGRLLARRGGV